MIELYRLQDSNLSSFAFNENGQEVQLTFVNMQDGSEIARLYCKGLVVLKYHSTSATLPLYVGEVTHEEIGGERSDSRLTQLGYGFTDQTGATLRPNSKRVHFVHVEGGDIDIDIACTEVEFRRSE